MNNMERIKPITFEEVHNSLKEEVPEEVISTINCLIKQNYCPIKRESTFSVRNIAFDCHISEDKEALEEKIVANWYDDIIDMYTNAGWNVEYYVTYSELMFSFSKK